MKKQNKFITIAKFLAIIYILFLSMFALDVFGEYKFPEVLLALLMHLIPSLILIGILIWAWKKPRIGGIFFIVLSIFFTIFFKTYQMWQSLVFLTLPLLVIGSLFILENKK